MIHLALPIADILMESPNTAYCVINCKNIWNKFTFLYRFFSLSHFYWILFNCVVPVNIHKRAASACPVCYDPLYSLIFNCSFVRDCILDSLSLQFGKTVLDRPTDRVIQEVPGAPRSFLESLWYYYSAVPGWLPQQHRVNNRKTFPKYAGPRVRMCTFSVVISRNAVPARTTCPAVTAGLWLRRRMSHVISAE